MNSKKILVVVAHPDDEILGLAGTLCRHRDNDENIAILILSNGEDSRGKISNSKKRFSQAKIVAKKLKAKLYLKNLPDNAFDSVTLLKIVKTVESVISSVKPDIIYTHNSNDLNIDHRLTFKAVITATRPQSDSFAARIYAFETPSSTEWQLEGSSFSPNVYIDISKYLQEKKELLSIYKDELRKFPHPRSLLGIETLARYRGMSCGCKAAEAFELIREVVS